MSERTDGFVLDATEQRLLCSGKLVPLARKPFAMLNYFVKNEGHLLPVQKILDNVWPDSIVSKHSVKDYVASIRSALQDNASKPQYIETVRGVGYRYLGGIAYKNPIENHLEIPGLPSDITPFLGRQQDLEKLSKTIEDPACRILTLTGPGGIGKTRLVQAFARNLRQQLPIYFISLKQIQNKQFVLAYIADILKIDHKDQPQSIESIAEQLPNERFIIILDNFDYDHHSSTLLSTMLQALPFVKLVITSREPTELYGEWIFNVGGLSLVGSENDSLGDALNLFIQTGRRANNNFSVNNDDLANISEICKILGGIPLAIEIAAPWVRTLSPQDLKDSLAVDPALLKNIQPIPGYGDLSLSVLMQQHWDSLEPDEQIILGVLSLFRGDCSERTLLSISKTNRDPIVSLREKLMLVHLNNDRYELHEVMREYAGAWLRSNDPENRYKSEFISYYMTLASEADEEILSARQFYWLKQLDAEKQNLRTVLDLCLQKQHSTYPYHSHGLQLVSDLAMYWFISNQWQEGIKYTETFLNSASPLDKLSRAKAQLTLGGLQALSGNYTEAENCLSNCIEAFKNGPPKQKARSFIAMGVVYRLQSRFQESIDMCRDSLAVYSINPDDGSALVALACIGQCHIEQENYSLAIETFKQSLEIGKHIGVTTNLPYALVNLGRAYWATQQYELARNQLCQSLTLAREINIKLYIAQALVNLGWVDISDHKLKDAQVNFYDAFEYYTSLGDQTGIAECLEGLAVIAAESNSVKTAAQLLASSEKLRTQIGSQVRSDCKGIIASASQSICTELSNQQLDEQITLGRSITPKLLVLNHLDQISIQRSNTSTTRH